MPTLSPGGLRGVLRRAWGLLDATRRAIANLLLLALLAALAWAAWHATPSLRERTTLVLALEGPIHEQFAGGLRASALAQAQGRPVAQLRLRDVLAVLDAAAHDPKIERVLLVLDDFAGAGLPTLRDVAAAIDRLKAAGKPVLAWGSSFDQRQYYLAAHASEVWLHPMGSVDIEGYGGHRNYYKTALDRLGITAHVLRVGDYKNAGESFVASAPSKQTLEEDRALYDALWASYGRGVERARKLAPGSLARAIDALPEHLDAAGGDMAKMALQLHWVDALKTRDEMRSALVARGQRDGSTFRQIGFDDYLARQRPASSGDAVGVVVAEGAIVDGTAPGGTIGGASTAELVRRAREDEHVKAVVLRVDSPGGSAFGAELVRRELELTRRAGKPVIVSMGDVAASGGYWISTAADEVIADEASVTGSIGVVAILPSAEQALAKLGIATGGYTTSWLVDAYDPRRGLDPRLARMLQASIDHVYADFTARVAAARKTTPERIDAVAQGRVWTGAQALARGLVDRNGSFADALQAAAHRARLPAGYRVQYLENEPGRLARWLERLGGGVAAALAPAGDAGALALPVRPALPVLQDALADASLLAAAAAPGAGRRAGMALTHCLCRAP